MTISALLARISGSKDPQEQSLLALGACLALFAVVQALAAIALNPESQLRWIGDGRVFYCAGRVALQGLNPYAPAPMDICAQAIGTDYVTRYVYPPWTLAAFMPIGALPPLAAGVLLQAAQAGAIFALIAVGLRFTRGYGLPVRLGFVLGPALCASTDLNLWLGQVNMIGIALIAIAALRLERGKDASAAALLIAAAALKPGFALFILVPAALARWRALGFTLAGGAGLGLASHLMAPAGIWAAYADSSMLAFVDRPLADWMRAGNHALAGPFSRMWEEPQIVWAGHAIALALIAGISTAAGLLSWLAPLRERLGAALALVAGFAFLAGPYSWWAHSTTLWLAAMALAPLALRAGAGWLPAVFGLALCAPVQLNDNPGGLLGALPTILALGLWAAAAWLLAQTAMGPLREAIARRPGSGFLGPAADREHAGAAYLHQA